MSQMRQFDYVPEEELDKKDGAPKKYTRAFFAEGDANFCISRIEDGETKAKYDENGDIIKGPRPKTVFHLDIVQEIDGQPKTGTFTVHVVKDKSMAWLLRNILNSVGKDLYRPGGFNDNEVLHKNGKLAFGVEDSPSHGVQNRVVKWYPYDGKAQPNKLAAGLPKADSSVDFDDDIPF